MGFMAKEISHGLWVSDVFSSSADSADCLNPALEFAAKRFGGTRGLWFRVQGGLRVLGVWGKSPIEA